MKLKKGSAAAKAYMAKIRGMKKTDKPVAGYIKTVRKGSATNVLYKNTTTAKKTAKPRQGTLFGSSIQKNKYSVIVDNFEGDTHEILLPFSNKTKAIKALKSYGIIAARDRYREELDRPGRQVAAYVYDPSISEIVTGYIVTKKTAKKITI